MCNKNDIHTVYDHIQNYNYISYMNNQWTTSPLKMGLDVIQSHQLHRMCGIVSSDPELFTEH